MRNQTHTCVLLLTSGLAHFRLLHTFLYAVPSAVLWHLDESVYQSICLNYQINKYLVGMESMKNNPEGICSKCSVEKLLDGKKSTKKTSHVHIS